MVRGDKSGVPLEVLVADRQGNFEEPPPAPALSVANNPGSRLWALAATMALVGCVVLGVAAGHFLSITAWRGQPTPTLRRFGGRG